MRLFSIALATLVAVHQNDAVSSFSISTTSRRAAAGSSLSMAGMGMGATASKKKGKKGAGSGKGAGKKPSEKFDIASAMMKSEKLYDELMAESARALNSDEWVDESDMDITTEYIVTARCRTDRALSDWVPVAQMCIIRPVHLDDGEHGDNSSIRAAVSHYRREISYAASLAAPAVKSIPRNLIEYAAEPTDSFMKFVYEDVIEGKATESYVGADGNKVAMTKARAREVLGLEAGCKDASLIKRAYKKQSMAYHPDRFVNSDKTKEELEETSNQFALVKMAYEALNSGVRSDGVNGSATNGDANGASVQSPASSWYESLGGKSRTEFYGPIDLLSSEKAGALCNKAFKSAVVGLDPDLVTSFVLRNQQTSMSTR